MKRAILALPTSGAGGDLQPLLAVVARLCERGRHVVVLGTPGVTSAMDALGAETATLNSGLDLGPRFAAAREETVALPIDLQGKEVGKRLLAWAEEAAREAQEVVERYRPSALITSLFGALVASRIAESAQLPWATVNSTFYIGPREDQPLELDIAPRTLIVFRDFLWPAVIGATLVLHATDKRFDLDFQHLPSGHHYVGPLLWEPSEPVPSYLQEPGRPWVLVTLSSDAQDDLPIARGALAALAPRPFRVLVTIGAGHDPDELQPVPLNARVEEHSPHGAVLDRSALLVAHAGHGSVMKALWHGVPMVLVPWGRDQPGVAERARRLGVALVVKRDRLSEAAIKEAMDLVLSDTGYRARAAAEARRLHAEDPSSRACDLIDQL